MTESLSTRNDAARPRLRSIVSTTLLVLISIMIVRDIFARRWATGGPPASDVTQQGLHGQAKSP